MDCSMCGTCCREIGANQWKYSPLVALGKLDGSPITYEKYRLEIEALNQIQDDKRCLMLSKDNLCIWHKVLGEWAKPKGCREWPKGEPNNICRFNQEFIKQ